MAWEQQSPINVRRTVRADAPKDYLRLAWPPEIEGFRRAGEHGVEIIFGVTPDNYLELGGKRFHLRQFHFHHPSEHLLDGRMFDGELHLVHQNLDDSTFAVVGIFLELGAPSRETKEAASLAESFLLANEPGIPIPTKPQWWLPRKRDRVLRYEGSLTTPPFTESVSWIILPEPKPIALELFKAIFGQQPQEARAIQPQNRRYILDLALKIAVVK